MQHDARIREPGQSELDARIDTPRWGDSSCKSGRGQSCADSSNHRANATSYKNLRPRYSGKIQGPDSNGSHATRWRETRDPQRLVLRTSESRCSEPRALIRCKDLTAAAASLMSDDGTIELALLKGSQQLARQTNPYFHRQGGIRRVKSCKQNRKLWTHDVITDA
jgi:hypothetical protein